MANFEPIIAWVLYQEDDHRAPGKIVNLNDNAGLTRLGLTQRWHGNDVIADYFTTMPFADAVKTAKQVYKDKYWGVLEGDNIESDIIAAQLLSFAVNDNSVISVQTLQKVLAVNQDGHMGPKTIAVVNSKDPEVISSIFRTEWIDFYQQLVKYAPSKHVFLEGWINRAQFPYPTTEDISIYL